MADAKKKTTAKGKSAPKSSSSARKAAPKKKPAAQSAASRDSASIAQRTASRQRRPHTGTACFFIILLLIMAGILKFCIPGYSFSAYLCAGIAGLIAFYSFVPIIFKRSRMVIRFVTFLLCIFLLVAGVTEALIISASFGNADEETEYLIVLGAKVRADGPSLSLLDRIDTAYDYLTDHPNTIAVVSGGKGDDEPITEAQCMHDSLVALGIEPSRIWVEDKATSTWENLQYSLALIEEKTGSRPGKIAVLSSEYHLFRASLFTKAAGADFIGVPAPTSNPFLKANYFLREVAGVWHYILLGSLGGHYHA